MNEVFKLMGTIAINNSKANAQITETTGKAEKAGGRISSAMKKIGIAVASAFAVAKIKQFGEACVEAYKIQEEAELKLETIMKQRMGSTDKGIQSIKDYASALQNVGVVGDEVQLSGAQQLATFLNTEDALKTLMPAMNNLAVQQNGVNVSSQNMTSIANMMGKAMQGQASALTRVGITMTDAQQKMLEMGTEEERAAILAEIITDNVGNMNEVLAHTDAGKIQQMKNSFGDLQEIIGARIMPALGSMAGVASKAIASITDVFNGDKTVGQAALQMMNSIIKGITQGIPKIIDKAVDIIDNLGNGLSSNTPKLLPKVVQIVVALVKALAQNAPKLIVSGAGLILRLAEGLIKSIPSLIKQIPKVISAIVTSLKGGNSTITNTGKLFIQWLWNGIKSLVSWIGGKVLSFAKSIPQKIKAGFAGVADIGANLVKGLWNGISNMASWIKSKIQGFGKSVLDALKSFFGIHSPSKVMEEQVGKQLALGVAQGIEKNKAYAKKSAQELGQAILDAAQKKLDNYKVYNEMTLASEVSYWNEVRKHCKKGTQARIDADKQYYDAKKSLDEQLIAAEAEYQSALDATYKKIADRTTEILSSFKLFDEYLVGDAVEGSTLITNLESQVNALDSWVTEINVLKGRLGDTALFDAIEQMGVDSLAQVKAINAMSESQLQQYVALYDKQQALAKKQAETDLADEVMADMQSAYENYKATLDALGFEVDAKYKTVYESIKTYMEDSEKITSDSIDDIYDAFKNGFTDAQTTVNKTMTNIVSTIQAKLAAAVAAAQAAAAEIAAAMAGSSGTTSGTTSDTKKTKVSKHAEGGIMTKPTIFGYTPSTNTYHIGGEAGAEAIAPIEKLQGYVAQAVASQNGALIKVLMMILDAIQNKDTTVEIDGKQIAKVVNRQLGGAY